MPLSQLTPAFTFTEDRLRELHAVVPEAFADGKVNWDVLREALGDYLEDDEQGAEHFGLSWPGKRDARRLAALPSKGTLIPAPGEGVNEDTTRNLFIEGDNLEVLKLLQKSYAGRVKMIYIDPPYNTGNDFVYKDDFKEPLEDYLRKTGQVGEQSELLTSNPKAGGRFHSNWLNMMFPRLVLARNLLTDDGCILISIDDNEVHNLRSIMNEIFGEENLISQFVWRSRQFTDARAVTKISTDHEYVLLYARTSDFSLRGIERDETKFSNPDKDHRGTWMSRSILGLATAAQRPNLHYAIVDPVTNNRFSPPPNTGWRYSKERMNDLIANKQILFPANPDGRPREKKFRSDMTSEFISFPTIIDDVFTANGTAEIRELFGFEAFDFPKPTELIRRLIKQATSQNSIVVDFFAGSCATAHATLDLNREDNGNRSFIMVQVPEATDNPKFPTIAEISKERIRRAIKKIKAEAKGKLKLGKDVDLGFKVLKLARSHYRAWQDYTGDYAEELETLFTQAETPLVEGWTPEGLLTETLLLEGFPLDSAVTEQAEFKHNQVWRVESDACAHRLWVCFDKKIKDKTLEALAIPDEDIFICLDSALTDEAKVRLSDLGNVHVI